MELRTHVWSALWTALAIVVVAVGGVWWVRPLPNRAGATAAAVEQMWETLQRGEVSPDRAAARLRGYADAGPGFGESRSDGSGVANPYDAVHRQAIAYLGRIDADAAFAALRELALHKDRQIDLYAVEALRYRGDRRALATLLAVLAIDDERQSRLNDDYARLTNVTLRAIRDMADSQALADLKRFADGGRRAFDQDIRRTITLIGQDLESLARAPGSESTATGPAADSLLAPDPSRLGTQILLSQPASLPASPTP